MTWQKHPILSTSIHLSGFGCAIEKSHSHSRTIPQTLASIIKAQMISDDQDGVKHWLWNHQWYVGEEENVSPVINAMLKYQLVWKI